MFRFHPLITASASVAAALLVTAAAIPMASAATATNSCTQQGKTMTCIWESPGTYGWTVPDNVTSVTVELQGAQGGTVNNGIGTESGGQGGYTKALMKKPASGWKPLQVNVGGSGKSVSGEPSGGYNGGGEASSYEGYAGGGGGGASDIRTSNDLNSRIVVAGGGGGGGWYMDGGAGGGFFANDGEGSYGYGHGATETAAGQGTSTPICAAGWNGEFGNGGNSYSCGGYGAGGGGGGWFGGGGATDMTGGGGGSSHVDSNYASVIQTANGTKPGNGEIVATYTMP